MDKGEFAEVYDPNAFDAHLPARLPVRGLDGEIISGVIADVTKDETGLVVTLTDVQADGEPRPVVPRPVSFAFRFPPGS